MPSAHPHEPHQGRENAARHAPSTGHSPSIAARIGVRQIIDLAPPRPILRPTPEFANVPALGRCAVLGSLGRGGMGDVFAARDLDLNREIAAKVMRPTLATDLDHVEKFLVEAQVTGQLEHPNIVPVHELGLAADGRAFFTMKLVRGHSLKAIISELRRRDRGEPATDATIASYRLTDLLEIFLKICDGVAFAHSRGVIHRDLKPENVMVGEFGEVLVMDWGLAKIRGVDDRVAAAVTIDLGAGAVGTAALDGDTAEQVHTLDGTVMGTPAYMPPEQARGDIAAIDTRSDVYSLGAILYVLLAHENPIDGSNAAEVVHAAARGEIVPLSASRRAISPELEAVVMKAMAFAPANRYASVPDLQQDIRAFIEGRTLAAVDYSWLGRLIKFVRRHRVLVGATAAVIVAAIAVFAVMAQIHAAREAQIDHERQIQISELATEAQSLIDAARAAEAIGDLDAASKALDKAATAFGQVVAISASDARGIKGQLEVDVRKEQVKATRQARQDMETAAREKAAREAAEQAARDARHQRANELLAAAKAQLSGARSQFASVVQSLGTIDENQRSEHRARVFAEFDAAQSKISQAVALDPDNSAIREETVKVARATAEAQQQWEVAVAKVVQFATAHHHLDAARDANSAGQLAWQQRDADAALGHWLDALNSANQSVVLFATLPMSDASREAAEQLKIDVLLHLTRQATTTGEFQIADFWATKAANAAGNGPRAGDVQEAKVELNRATSIARGYRAKFNAGQKATQTGDFEAAVTAFHEARQILDTPEIRAEIARANFAWKLQLARAARDDRRWRDGWERYAEAENFVAGNDERRIQLEFLRAELAARATTQLTGAARAALAEGSDAALRAAEAAIDTLIFITGETADALVLRTQLTAKRNSPTGFVYVPAGRVALGSARESDHNPPRLVELTAFYIATREITVAEFAAFIDAGGYSNREWWSEVGWQWLQALPEPARKPMNWASQAASPSWPTVGVNQYEADAYCRWLSATHGAVFRLPTDEEWETVARHEPANMVGVGRLFPWGNDWVAGRLATIAEMQPVGSNPLDKSAFGCLDLGGNVAEWVTFDAKSAVAIAAESNTAGIRGAGAGLPVMLRERFALTTKRGFAPPESRMPYVGFRLVRAISPK